MCVGTRGNISDMRGNEGESGESVQDSEILLWRRPRPLGRRISEDGDVEVGDWGDCGHGTVERCEMAPLEEGRPHGPLKYNLETMLVMRWRSDIERED